MDDFSRLLAYFADSKVEALVLQSDRAIAVRINGEFAALSPTALEDAKLRQLLYTSALAPQLDALGQAPITVPLAGPQGIDLLATLRTHRDGLHCSLTRAADRRPQRHMSIPPNAPQLSQATGPARLERVTQRSTIPPVAKAKARPQPSQAPPEALAPDPASAPAGKTTHPQFTHKSPAQTPASPAAPRNPVTPPSAPPAANTKPSAPAPASPPASSAKRPARPKLRRKPGQKDLTALEKTLASGRELGASDIHIVSDSPVLYRRMGSLERHGEALDDRWVKTMVDQMLDDRSRAQLQELGYADFAFESNEVGRFRANVCRHKHGLKACLRVLPQSPPSLEELGLPDELGQVLRHHQGLAIIAGPNGQGKSTTLAALVNKLNQERAIHVITVEDPIEVVHPIGKAVISQRQVGRDTKSFQSALKASLREDPDVIVIGELRDRETVEMALSAAETGHLVIATMNTPSGAKTIGRLIDLFPPDDQSQVRATLAGTLMIVAAQRLVPRADASSMVAAVELITGGTQLWSLIRDNKLVQLPGLMQRGKRMGMVRLQDSLQDLLAQGVIDGPTMDQALALERGTPATKPAPKAA